MRRRLCFAVLIVGCAAAAPTPAVTTGPVSSGAEAPSDVPIAGFVIYEEGGTTVVPFDGHVVHGSPLWLLDDHDPAAPQVIQWAEGAPGDLACECDVDAACRMLETEWSSVSYDASGAVIAIGPNAPGAPPCACFQGVETPDEECDNELGAPQVVSLAGGALYRIGGAIASDCGAMRTIDSTGSVQQLVPGVTPLDHAAIGGDCYSQILRAAGWPADVLASARCGGDAPVDDAAGSADPLGIVPADEACVDCVGHSGDEANALFLRRGRVARVGTTASVSFQMTYVETSVADAGHCPSAADPCGDPAAFPDIESYTDWWIATDGSAAFVARDAGGWIWVRGSEPRHVDMDPSAIIGVRFHRDVRPLLARMGEDPSDFATFMAPANAECESQGGNVGEGDMEAREPRLAPEDEDFVDTHGGRDWGNRCFAHVREDDLEAAAAACARGMAQATEPAVEGALHYNLGRIAEANGDTDGARLEYERSLQLRPGNAAVEARIDSLR